MYTNTTLRKFVTLIKMYRYVFIYNALGCSSGERSRPILDRPHEVRFCRYRKGRKGRSRSTSVTFTPRFYPYFPQQYEIVILGGLAGRLDQTIHTLSYLHKLRKVRDRVYAVTDDNLGWVLDSVRPIQVQLGVILTVC